MVHDIGDVYILPRLYDKADEFYDRSIQLAPDQVLAYACQAENHWLWRGDLAKGRELLAKMPYKSDPRSLRHLFRQELFARDYEAALEIMDNSPATFLKGPWVYLPVQAYRGLALELLGRDVESLEAYEEAVALLERDIAIEPQDDRIHAGLGLCYAKVGRKEEAIAAGLKGTELVPYEVDAHAGCERLHDLARIYAIVGEVDKSVDILEQLMNVPAFVTPAMLRIDPRWDSIRDHPRFQAIAGEAAEPSA
ncbi:MAG: TPR end-of-group domain-containing protein [Planctomycetota bacterium]